MKIYVASSWRNERQPEVVALLRELGHAVFDFRSPHGRTGFHWSHIDPKWQSWSSNRFRAFLNHPLARGGLTQDYEAMRACEAVVLVMPCGRSSHLELGWFIGRDRPSYILLCDGEPELMYGLATKLCTSLEELREEFE